MITDLLRRESSYIVSGRVARVTGHHVDVAGLRLRIGDALNVHTADGLRPAEVHVRTSRRLLNDLRSLRRLLFGERGRPAHAARLHQPTPYDGAAVAPGVTREV